MDKKQEEVRRIRKMSQQHSYTSIQMHEAIGRKLGLSGTDHKYLGFLLVHGAMTAGAFAAITGLTTGAMTGLIDRFEKRKLVKRQADKSDRRKIIIVPNSDRITKLITPYYIDFQNNTDEILSEFSVAQLKVLERYFTNTQKLMNDKIQQLNNL
jgi:DNA-binding MarR family transcriptional regulator